MSGCSASRALDEVDELLEGGLLLVAARGPQRGEVVVGVGDAPEVLEAAVDVPERVALEVEEEVAGGGIAARPLARGVAQSEVWTEIGEKQARMSVDSPTSAARHLRGLP